MDVAPAALGQVVDERLKVFEVKRLRLLMLISFQCMCRETFVLRCIKVYDALSRIGLLRNGPSHETIVLACGL